MKKPYKRKQRMDKGTFVLAYLLPFIAAVAIGLWLWLLSSYL